MFLCRSQRSAVCFMLRPGAPFHLLCSPFSTNNEDPDKYRGPGGLTARQIFQAVQESNKRDADAAADLFASAEALSGQKKSENSAAGTKNFHKMNTFDDNRLEKMSAKDLCALLKEHSIDYHDCLEKRDLISRVKESRLEPEK
mmetsp:Transcript_6563/g.8871  ORF Transcript_6563/g.8871 Transcript_6563/m.8871 type:complete len:143 (-) Transcript_6563:213-641(-)